MMNLDFQMWLTMMFLIKSLILIFYYVLMVLRFLMLKCIAWFRVLFVDL